MSQAAAAVQTTTLEAPFPHAQHRADAPPPPCAGELGDIWIATKPTTMLYGKVADGWKPWPGPKGASTPVEHQGYVLNVSLGKPICAGWMDRKSLEQRMVGGPSELVVKVLTKLKNRSVSLGKRKASDVLGGDAKRAKTTTTAPVASGPMSENATESVSAPPNLARASATPAPPRPNPPSSPTKSGTRPAKHADTAASPSSASTRIASSPKPVRPDRPYMASKDACTAPSTIRAPPPPPPPPVSKSTPSPVPAAGATQLPSNGASSSHPLPSATTHPLRDLSASVRKTALPKARPKSKPLLKTTLTSETAASTSASAPIPPKTPKSTFNPAKDKGKAKEAAPAAKRARLDDDDDIQIIDAPAADPYAKYKKEMTAVEDILRTIRKESRRPAAFPPKATFAATEPGVECFAYADGIKDQVLEVWRHVRKVVRSKEARDEQGKKAQRQAQREWHRALWAIAERSWVEVGTMEEFARRLFKEGKTTAWETFKAMEGITQPQPDGASDKLVAVDPEPEPPTEYCHDYSADDSMLVDEPAPAQLSNENVAVVPPVKRESPAPPRLAGTNHVHEVVDLTLDDSDEEEAPPPAKVPSTPSAAATETEKIVNVPTSVVSLPVTPFASRPATPLASATGASLPIPPTSPATQAQPKNLKKSWMAFKGKGKQRLSERMYDLDEEDRARASASATPSAAGTPVAPLQPALPVEEPEVIAEAEAYATDAPMDSMLLQPDMPVKREPQDAAPLKLRKDCTEVIDLTLSDSDDDDEMPEALESPVQEPLEAPSPVPRERVESAPNAPAPLPTAPKSIRATTIAAPRPSPLPACTLVRPSPTTPDHFAISGVDPREYPNDALVQALAHLRERKWFGWGTVLSVVEMLDKDEARKRARVSAAFDLEEWRRIADALGVYYFHYLAPREEENGALMVEAEATTYMEAGTPLVESPRELSPEEVKMEEVKTEAVEEMQVVVQKPLPVVPIPPAPSVPPVVPPTIIRQPPPASQPSGPPPPPTDAPSIKILQPTTSAPSTLPTTIKQEQLPTLPVVPPPVASQTPPESQPPPAPTEVPSITVRQPTALAPSSMPTTIKQEEQATCIPLEPCLTRAQSRLFFGARDFACTLCKSPRFVITTTTSLREQTAHVATMHRDRFEWVMEHTKGMTGAQIDEMVKRKQAAARAARAGAGSRVS
ncbi:hypothetical protein MKEN_00026400 [Mycena kentingensis (nom. inval.)]|nr:hypothetical protein MKEN_00026400 [Mycena kentingensis (nom. inval.)]